MSDESAGPFQKMLHVGPVGVSAVVLAPGKPPVEQADIHPRHLGGVVVLGDAQPFCPEQDEYRARGRRRHEASLLVEPLGVTFLRQSVTDESQARRTQGDEFVGVYRQVGCILATESRVRRPILHEVASHPVVFAAGEILHSFAKITA